MKKKVTITICDICEEEDKLHNCCLCDKEICDSCCIVKESQYGRADALIICEHCIFDEEQLDKHLRKFFKQPDIIKINEDLKKKVIDYLKAVVTISKV